MGIFGKIGKADVFGSSRPLALGNHTVEVHELVFHEGKGQKQTDWFIAEVDVVESQGHAPGETRSWVVDLGQASGPSNAKALLVAIAQCADPTVSTSSLSDAEWETYAERLICPTGPAAGIRLKVEVFLTKTRAGGDFSKHVWSPLPSQDAARVHPRVVLGGSAPAPAPASPAPAPAPNPAGRAVPPALAEAVASWRSSGRSDAEIKVGLGTWAAGAFGPGALEAALA